MSDIKHAISICLAVLVPLKFSSEVKQFLVENNLYQNKFRPQRVSEKLALPIQGNYENMTKEISEKIPSLSAQISIEEIMLEINTPNLNPAQLMSSNISSWSN